MHADKSPQFEQQRVALNEHLASLADVLAALRFSFSERVKIGGRKYKEASELSFMVDAFNGEFGKLYDSLSFGPVVDEGPVYRKICHVQGLVYLLGDGLGSVCERQLNHSTPLCLDWVGIKTLIGLLVSAFESLRDSIGDKSAGTQCGLPS